MDEAMSTYMSDKSLIGFGLGSEVKDIQDIVAQSPKTQKSFFVKYISEIAYGLRQSVIINLSLYHIMLVYLIFLVTKNIEDGNETAISNGCLTAAGGLEFFLKMLASYYKWNKKRKLSITLGCLILACLTVIIGFL